VSHAPIEIIAHKSSGYGPRTYANAHEGDLTIAVAANYKTVGERLTHKAAGDKFLALPLAMDALEAARLMYRTLRDRDLKNPVINVAGNGMQTMNRNGFTQEFVNIRLLEILSPVHKHWPIAKVISGGQTGADMAGGIAAHALGIPVKLHFPAGFKQRYADGVDRPFSKDEILQQVTDGVAALKQEAQKRREQAQEDAPSP
jgi:hypothetical protein